MTFQKELPSGPWQAGWRPTARQHVCLGAVILVALAVRGLYLWGQAQNNPLFDAPVMDGLVHDEWARQIAAGEGMGDRPYFRAPLYYYLLGLLYKLFGPSIAVGRIAGGVLGAITCYLIARLAAAIGGFSAGLLAGLLAALYWPLVYFDGELLTVGLEVFLDVAMLLLFVLAARRRALGLFALAGLAWGLSAITRPNVLALAPGIIIWIWFALGRPRRWARWLRTTVVTGVMAALPVLPVTLRNYFVSGELVLVAAQGGVNFYIGNNPYSNGYVAVVPGTRPDWWGGYEDTHRIVERALGRPPTESEVSRFWYGKAFEWIRSDPGAWLRLMLLKLRLFWSPLEVPNNQPIRFFAALAPVARICWIGFPVVAVLGVAGLARCGTGLLTGRSTDRSGDRSHSACAWALLVMFLLIYMATVVAFFCPARYRLPVIPVLIVGAATGLVQLPHLLRGRRYRSLIAYAAVIAAMAVIVATNPPENRAAFQAYADSEAHRLLAVHYRERQPRTPADVDHAATHYRAAAKLNPDEPHLRRDLATLLIGGGRGSEAIPHLIAFVEARPEDWQMRRTLAHLLYGANRVSEAVEHLRTLVRQRPPARKTLMTLAMALVRLGRHAEAIPHFRRALRMQPDSAELRYHLARALRRSGGHSEAIEVLREGLRQSPEDTRLLTALAWLRATAPRDELRNAAEAVQLAERALAGARTPTVEILDALAAAYAEAGRFDDAVRTARQALETAGRRRSAKIAARLRLYEQKRPYRDE